MLFQDRADNAPLDAFSASMDQAHGIEAGASALIEVLFDNPRYILGSESVEIDGVLDGNDDGLSEGRLFFVGHTIDKTLADQHTR